MLFSVFVETYSVPIDTPDVDERNNLVIRSPDGWGYRTFRGNNGLIGVFWPKGTSFNKTDTAVFVFLQDSNEQFPEIPDNINLFTEKCTKATFKFAEITADENPTKSLGEKYFNGRCGHTMILSEEKIDNYRIVIALVSAKPYVTKTQLRDLKEISNAYRRETEEYITNKQNINLEDDEEDNDSDDKNSQQQEQRPYQEQYMERYR